MKRFLSSVDSKLYQKLAQAAELGIPILWTSDESAKHELIAMLRKEIDTLNREDSGA